MKKYKDMFMWGILIFIFLGSIIYNAYEMDTNGLKVAKKRIASAKRIVIALQEFKKYDVEKEFVYSYRGIKYEVIKDVTNQEEMEKIKNAVLKAEYPSLNEDVSLNKDSAMLIQFYDESNTKVVEYDLLRISIGYNNRSFKVEISSEEYALLHKYFEEYSDLVQEYLA